MRREDIEDHGRALPFREPTRAKARALYDQFGAEMFNRVYEFEREATLKRFLRQLHHALAEAGIATVEQSRGSICY